MSAPTVSVLMAAYNRAAYIGPAIESVLAQQYADFELVVCDDCSSDDTVEIARRYAVADSRVRVEVNEKNLGQFGNRNRAASIARGTWLKYFDSDDVMYPHCLSVLMACQAQAPEVSAVVSSLWPGGPNPMLLTPKDAYEREFLGAGCLGPGPGSLLIRRDAFMRVGMFPDQGVGSDSLFLLRLCTTDTIATAPFDLFWYRIHPGQALQAPGAEREYARVLWRVWEALHAPECPLNGPSLERARRNHAWNVLRQMARDLKRGRPGTAWVRLRSAGLSIGDWARYLRRPSRDPLAGTPSAAEPIPIPAWARRG